MVIKLVLRKAVFIRSRTGHAKKIMFNIGKPIFIDREAREDMCYVSGKKQQSY